MPPGKRVIAAENNDAVDEAVSRDQGDPLRLNHPGHVRFRETMLERRGSGQGVNDIAHRSKPDDEDAFHLCWQLTSLTGEAVKEPMLARSDRQRLRTAPIARTPPGQTRLQTVRVPVRAL